MQTTLPRTIYLWLALLIVSMLLGPTLAPLPSKNATRAASPSGPAFENYLEAERLTRTYYAYPLTGNKSLREAQEIYRSLSLKETRSPNLARKALILGNQLKKPLDKALLKSLPTAEQPLWQALYGKDETPMPADAETQLRAMRLKFLDNQALADLYRKLGKAKAASQAEARRDAQANKVLWQVAPLMMAGFLLGLVGLFLLVFILLATVRREWHWLGQVPTPVEPKLGWGDLLDGFVFYLGVYRGMGLLLALLLRGLDLHPLRVPTQVALQAGTGLLAVLYLAAKAKKRGASLAELGWSRERLGSDILYGIAGYAATLPLTVVLGMLSKALFRNNTNTEPNAILPLLTGSSTLWERGLLFASAALFAPLFEELFFRGALLTGLRRRFAGLPSILISAIVFASVHPPQDWLPILGLGISFGIMRQLRQSVVPGITAHFLQNAATYLMLSALFAE